MSRRTPTITRKEKDFAAYYRNTELRSKKARDVDRATDKNVTNNFAEWWWDDSRSDWPNIDTVLGSAPMGYTKSKGKKAHDEIIGVFGKGRYY